MLKINEYKRPPTLDEALAILAEPAGRFRVLAGGTDLVISLTEKNTLSDILDIGLLDELKEIREAEDGIIVGAAASFASIENSETVKKHCPALAKAASMVGSPQIRNVGTIGGNIANASPAADSVPTVVAFGGEVILKSKEAKEPRRIPVTSFLKGINKTDIKENELITGVFIPKMDGFSWGFSKLGRRKALAIARLSCVVGIKASEDGTITDARVALGAVAPNPFRSEIIEKALTGENINNRNLDNILKSASHEVEERIGERPSMPYKRGSIQGLIIEAYGDAIKMIRGSGGTLE